MAGQHVHVSRVLLQKKNLFFYYVLTFSVYTLNMRLEEEIQQPGFSSEYHKLMVNLLYTGNWATAVNKRFLKPYKLSPEQYNLLRILRGLRGEPASVATLNERMLDKMSNVSRLVEKLRLKKLIERTENPADRRQVEVKMTPEGQDLLETIDQRFPKLLETFSSLNQQEAAQLNRLLDKCRNKK